MKKKTYQNWNEWGGSKTEARKESINIPLEPASNESFFFPLILSGCQIIVITPMQK
jgi:hypothetical protein